MAIISDISLHKHKRAQNVFIISHVNEENNIQKLAFARNSTY